MPNACVRDKKRSHADKISLDRYVTCSRFTLNTTILVKTKGNGYGDSQRWGIYYMRIQSLNNFQKSQPNVFLYQKHDTQF